jgi:hypothetical protein
MTVLDLVSKMVELAPEVGLPAAAVPTAVALRDSVNGRHWPSLTTVLLVSYVTNGDVDLEHWVRDLVSR